MPLSVPVRASVPGPGAGGPVVLPGALSPLTADLVLGPRRTALVVAVSRHGTYLALGARVLPVLGRGAPALPGALRLAGDAGPAVLGATTGDRVEVGERMVRLPAATVRAARTWRPHRVGSGSSVRSGGDARRVRAALAAATADAPAWLSAGAHRAVTDLDPSAAVHDLVGRGPGLTPSGDDALAGALLLLRACGDHAGRLDALVAAVRARAGSTTAVSAALLDAAADGWAAPEVVALVDAVAVADAQAVATALPAVLATGHTSGRDLVTGVAAALAQAPALDHPARPTVAA